MVDCIVWICLEFCSRRSRAVWCLHNITVNIPETSHAQVDGEMAYMWIVLVELQILLFCFCSSWLCSCLVAYFYFGYVRGVNVVFLSCMVQIVSVGLLCDFLFVCGVGDRLRPVASNQCTVFYCFCIPALSDVDCVHALLF